MTESVLTLSAHQDASGAQFLNWLNQYMQWATPAVIVEAGTFEGHFALVAAKTSALYGFPCHVWTADVQSFGIEAKVAEHALDNLHVHIGDFAEMLEASIGERSVDLAYIDSGKTYGVDVQDDIRWQHFLAVQPFMKRGGLVVVDDTQRDASWAHKDDIKLMGTTIGSAHRSITLVEAR